MIAIDQLEAVSSFASQECGDSNSKSYQAYTSLLHRSVPDSHTSPLAVLSQDSIAHPLLVTLGGDHTIVLPILRSLNKVITFL